MNIDSSLLRKEIKTSDRLSLIQFKKDWSGSCQIIAPVYEDLEKMYIGQAAFYIIDVEQEAGIEKEFGIQEYPTILFYRNGELVDHAIGLVARDTLIQKIEQTLYK